jgi:hypothetical protein
MGGKYLLLKTTKNQVEDKEILRQALMTGPDICLVLCSCLLYPVFSSCLSSAPVFPLILSCIVRFSRSLRRPSMKKVKFSNEQELLVNWHHLGDLPYRQWPPTSKL